MSAIARALRLSELLAGITDPAAAGDILVRGLTQDSRTVQAGDVFVALQGAHAHGITFAPAALARGASVVLAEAPVPAVSEKTSKHASLATAPVIWIEGLRAQLGALAARFFDHPSAALHVIGVTGTNGKTSIVQFLAQALSGAGRRVATIGTLGAGLHGALLEGERTTPDAITVHELLAGFRAAGATDVAMEVSSHALDQGRVDAVTFAIAVFTNLTRDHLDYHDNMQAYAATKAKLFSSPGLLAAVINVDDAFGRELIAQLPANVREWHYGIERSDVDISAHDLRSDSSGFAFRLTTPWGTGTVKTGLLGRFNVANALAVAGCLGELGFNFVQIQNMLSRLQPVAGRMNIVRVTAGLPLVVIDYAHTPDALEQALTALRTHCSGKLFCVFGCGGERDAGKRPQMGAVAEQLADRVIVTDDNPRAEEGDTIVAHIIAGFSRPQMATTQRDRAKAIKLALDEARSGDAVLIAGKGHEPYQEIVGVKHGFDDLAVARRLLGTWSC